MKCDQQDRSRFLKILRKYDKLQIGYREGNNFGQKFFTKAIDIKRLKCQNCYRNIRFRVDWSGWLEAPPFAGPTAQPRRPAMASAGFQPRSSSLAWRAWRHPGGILHRVVTSLHHVTRQSWGPSHHHPDQARALGRCNQVTRKLRVLNKAKSNKKLSSNTYISLECKNKDLSNGSKSKLGVVFLGQSWIITPTSLVSNRWSYIFQQSFLQGLLPPKGVMRVRRWGQIMS